MFAALRDSNRWLEQKLSMRGDHTAAVLHKRMSEALNDYINAAVERADLERRRGGGGEP
jgi:hypothetical protein